jgi:glycosyltransferase involved in cell wall biosynthesis
MKNNTYTPLVSIIVPVYNAELYIPQCIESILAQTYKNIEIILINDGSTDQSKKILESFGANDQRVKVVNKVNAGVSKARNTGIVMAEGEYITFVDADDTLDVNAVTTMIDLMETSNADVVRTNYVSYRSGIQKKGSLPIPAKLYEGNDILKIIQKVIMGNIPGYSWLLLIRIDLLRKHEITFDSSLSMMEDTKFYVDLFGVSRSVFLSDTVTYSYMINTTSASRNIHNYKRNANDIIKLNQYFKDNFSQRIANLDRDLDADHTVFLTSQIALAVEYPNHAYGVAMSNLAWLSSNKSFRAFYENSNFSNASIYSRLVVFFIKKKITLAALSLFIIRGFIRRFV